MTNTVTAMFETRAAMEDCLRRLEPIGITNDQIGVVMNDTVRGKHFTLENHSKADEGVAAGATLGGILGGLLTALAGAGTLLIPGLNIIVAGPIVAGLAGAGLGAATGGILGGLVGMGVTEHEAKLYESGLKAGNILLAIKARDSEQAKEVRTVMRDTQAFNIAA